MGYPVKISLLCQFLNRYILRTTLHRVISKGGLTYHNIGSTSPRGLNQRLRHRFGGCRRLLSSKQCDRFGRQCGKRPSFNQATGPNYVKKHPGYQKVRLILIILYYDLLSRQVPKVSTRSLVIERASPDPCRPSSTRPPPHGESRWKESRCELFKALRFPEGHHLMRHSLHTVVKTVSVTFGA